MVTVKKNMSGFSLMEIMIAIAIIGVMAALVGPNLLKFLGSAKTSSTKSNLAALKSAMLDYNADIGHFPTKAEGGLQALVKMPKGDKFKTKWQGYLEVKDGELPQDAWGFDFVYANPPVKYKQYKHYEIYSGGEKNDVDAVNDLHVGA